MENPPSFAWGMAPLLGWGWTGGVCPVVSRRSAGAIQLGGKGIAQADGASTTDPTEPKNGS